MTFTGATGPKEFNSRNLLELVAGSWYCMHRCKRVQLQCKYMNRKLLLFADTHLLSGCNPFLIPVPKEKLAVGHEVFLVHILKGRLCLLKNRVGLLHNLAVKWQQQ